MRADWPQYSAGPHLTGRKEIHSYNSYKSNTLFSKVFVRKVPCHLLFMHKRALGGFPKVAKERKKLFYPLKKALSFMVIRLVHLLLQKVLCHQPTFASTTTWDLSCTGNQIRDTSQSWNSCVRISLRNFPMTTINGCKAQNKENKDISHTKNRKKWKWSSSKISQPVAVYWLSCHLSTCHISKTFD